MLLNSFAIAGDKATALSSSSPMLLAQATIGSSAQPIIDPSKLPITEPSSQSGPPSDTQAPGPSKIHGNDVEDEVKSDVQGRTVYIQLKKAKGAVKSQIQIRPHDQNWATPFVITTETEENRIRLTPSHYAIRTRSITEKNEFSPWSPWGEFWVNHYVPENVFPADKQVIPPMDEKLEKLTFEWPPIPGTSLFYVEVRDEKGNQIAKKVVNKNWFRYELPVAKKYKWSLYPLVNKEEAAVIDRKKMAWKDFEIANPEAGKKTIYFEISKKNKVASYQYEIVKILPNKRVSTPSIYDAKEPDMRVRLSPGTYDMRSRYVLEDNQFSDWSPPQSFHIKLPRPKLLSPEANSMLEAVDIRRNSTRFEWESNPLAAKYVIRVKSKNTNEVFTQTTEDNFAKFDLAEGEEYTWEVVAFNIGETVREPAAVEEVKGINFSYEKMPRLFLSPAEEPGQWYGWTRYMNSTIDYQGDNFDNNTRTKQNLNAGSVEGATGYWFRKTDLGLLAHYSISGFQSRGKTYDYSSFGAHLGLRQKESDSEDTYRIRYWLGFSYREFPELVGNLSSGSFTYSKIATSGPQFTVSYLNTFNKLWGYQTYAELYYSANGLRTPTGQDLVPQYSAKMGLYLTYKYSDEFKWMAGYAYNLEQLKYRSMGVHGDNLVTVQGHYLSIIIETTLGGARDK